MLIHSNPSASAIPVNTIVVCTHLILFIIIFVNLVYLITRFALICLSDFDLTRSLKK